VESETPSTHPEVPAQFPALQQVPGNLTFNLTLDKSVNKALEKFISIIIANSMAIGIAIVLAIWVISKFSSVEAAYQEQEREARMVEYYIHEVDGKLISAGFLKPSQNFDNFKRKLEAEEKSK
jgi:hypothetical protein